MELGVGKARKVTISDFWKKIWFSRNLGKSGKKCHFSTFVKNLTMDLVSKWCLNERYYGTGHYCENRMSGKNLVLPKCGKKWQKCHFWLFFYLNERPGTLNGWIWRIFCFSHLSWQYGFKIYSRPCILKLYFWSKNRTRNIWCEKQQKTPYFTFVSVQLVFFVSYKHVAKHL